MRKSRDFAAPMPWPVADGRKSFRDTSLAALCRIMGLRLSPISSLGGGEYKYRPKRGIYWRLPGDVL